MTLALTLMSGFALNRRDTCNMELRRRVTDHDNSRPVSPEKRGKNDSFFCGECPATYNMTAKILTRHFVKNSEPFLKESLKFKECRDNSGKDSASFPLKSTLPFTRDQNKRDELA